jgi:hypothetical protein
VSDEQIPDIDQLDAARADIASALGQYADGWESTEGAIVTSFVCIAEAVSPNGSRCLIEIYADGEGSAVRRNWNHEGMLWSILNDPAQ